MKTLFKPTIWNILKLFYENKNKSLHLREISRKTNINESSISRHLNNLTKEGILKIEREANLKKFSIKTSLIPDIFPHFDTEKLETLPLLRRDTIKLYINKLEKKPTLLIIFGSTAKGNFKKDSDIDLLEINSSKKEDKQAKKFAESQTGINLQFFNINEEEFKRELKMKKDKVVQSALETGFPVFNAKYYYEEIYNE